MPSQNNKTAPEPRPKRQKIDHACDLCRARKVKCDGNRDGCETCAKRTDLVCTYTDEPTPKPPDKPARQVKTPSSSRSASSTAQPAPSIVKPEARPSSHTILHTPAQGGLVPQGGQSARGARGGGHQPGSSSRLAPSPGSHRESRSLKIDSMNNLHVDGESTAYFGEPSGSLFTQVIKNAFDTKPGGTPPASASAAGLSSSFANSSNNNNNNSSNPTSGPKRGPASAVPTWRQSLPSRPNADKLIAQYWRYVDPLYPFLDQARWQRSYDALYNNTPLDTDERIFVTTLNVIFALSSVILEDLPPDQRRQGGELYFRRAQEVLKLDLWESGSLELVQCLLLMTQYLQSTNASHQTWMVVGAAARIAVSLGLHLEEPMPGLVGRYGVQLLRRVWYGCVLMDRMITFTHGRPGFVSIQLASGVPYPRSSAQTSPLNSNTTTTNANTDRNGNKSSSNNNAKDEDIPEEELSRMAFFVKSVELYEIIYRRFQLGTRVQPPESASVPQLSTVMELDEAMITWEKGLPEHLRYPPVIPPGGPVETCERQALILRIRFLHGRMLLLRPLFVQACGQSQLDDQPENHKDPEPRPQPEPEPEPDTLRDRVVNQCASFCVVLARHLITLLARQHRRDRGALGLQPAWWYRVYYIYGAALVVAAAKARPDLFDPAEMRAACEEATRFLREHEGFGLSVRMCSENLAEVAAKTPNLLQDVAGAPMPGLGVGVGVGVGQGLVNQGLGAFGDAFLGGGWQPYAQDMFGLPFSGVAEPMAPMDAAQLYVSVPRVGGGGEGLTYVPQ